MCGWMRASVKTLRPLYDRMVENVLRSRVIHTDDTTVPVLDRTLSRTKTGRFRVYVGDVEHPDCVYDYRPSRSRDGPEQFLHGFQGYLQADAFAGYHRLYAGPDVTEVACWARTRRKFFDARMTSPQLVHDALARIGQLYGIEKRSKHFSDARRYTIRQKETVPLLEALGEWLTLQRRRVFPKSPIGQAVAYAHSNWTALCRYTEAGFLSIDNNLSERMLRAQAIGRNWMFAGSDVGGETAALLFSFVASCKHKNGLIHTRTSPTCCRNGKPLRAMQTISSRIAGDDVTRKRTLN
jgi:transposase